MTKQLLLILVTNFFFKIPRVFFLSKSPYTLMFDNIRARVQKTSRGWRLLNVLSCTAHIVIRKFYNSSWWYSSIRRSVETRRNDVKRSPAIDTDELNSP